LTSTDLQAAAPCDIQIRIILSSHHEICETGWAGGSPIDARIYV
jgi:hypothetical protein